MTATILTHKTQKMSAIFPTAPPEGTLHFIPKNAEFISYRVEDNLTLSAWMPDGFYTVETKFSESNDQFFENHCDNCERNCYTFLDDYLDEDGDICWDDIPNGHCDVYNDGYHGQPCPKGYEKEEEELDFPVSNMVFEISLSHLGTSNKFSRQSDTAFLCASKLIHENKILATDVHMASNVFGSSDSTEGICWGYNEKPDNLSGIVTEYVSTPFNNDLLPIKCFYDNCQEVRLDIQSDNYELLNFDRYLCTGKSALLLLDASRDISAFFQMITAGFTSLPKAPHIMILPLSEKTITVGTHSVAGYCTDLDSVGKSWFVSNSGQILGQVDGF
jgi:hypothetical protein